MDAGIVYIEVKKKIELLVQYINRSSYARTDSKYEMTWL
jgi:hypothetical protein